MTNTDTLPESARDAVHRAEEMGHALAEMYVIAKLNGDGGDTFRVDLEPGDSTRYSILVIAPHARRIGFSPDDTAWHASEERPTWHIGLLKHGRTGWLDEWNGLPIHPVAAAERWGGAEWTGMIMSAFLTALSERVTELDG